MSTALPSKLSDLLELAVRDAQKCEAQPERFRLDMGKWHSPLNSGVCAVCMAGAVLAQTVGMGDDKEIIWSDLDDWSGVRAINEMRTGDFCDAAVILDVALSDDRVAAALLTAERLVKENLPEVSDEEENDEDGFDREDDESPGYRAPWETYTRAAAILREAGL